MQQLLIAMGLFGLVGAITPGPVNILAIRRSAPGHGRAAVAYVLGASVSYALVSVLTEF
jgi:threonine/homoserine/homoserine lactone efflux protein